MTANITTHRTVEKALDILMCFVPNNQEMGTTEISRIMGFNKSTTSRLLHVLSQKGFLQQNPETKKFQLGPAAMFLGTAIRQSLNSSIVQIAKPYMEQLRDRISESVLLEIFSEPKTVLTHLVTGPYRVNMAGNIGDILCSHASAGGKAIVAHSSTDVRRRILKRSLPTLTKNTITAPDILQRHFEKIKETGIAFDNEEHEQGICAMGAPIFDYTRTPIAALVAVGPCQRIKPETDSFMARKLKEAAMDISKRLLYSPDVPDGDDLKPT